ncbi:hypothetical protein, partial [Mesorhizobium sp. M8A.F.Ca.ET.213.01.1.1]|uniref:hypothetical protein n=1 Tax=Mesorhizobium sp. M8A.F.Ca.ET.213.01.1.1 TaxID=2563970 RepID=UPI001AED9FCA
PLTAEACARIVGEDETIVSKLQERGPRWRNRPDSSHVDKHVVMLPSVGGIYDCVVSMSFGSAVGYRHNHVKPTRGSQMRN